jgi:hypothetical protein
MQDQEFRFIKDEYTDRTSNKSVPFRKKMIKDRSNKTGTTCRICFMKRSMNGTCSCTEYYN